MNLDIASILANYGSYILISYVIARIAVVCSFKIGRKYYSEIPDKSEREYAKSERSTNLTLAGFSLTALTLFLTIPAATTTTNIPHTTNTTTTNSLDEAKYTTLYLSISLTCFIIAAYLSLVWSARYFLYAAESLQHLGISSAVFAILLFFIHGRESFVEIVYSILFVGILIMFANDFAVSYSNLNGLRDEEPKPDRVVTKKGFRIIRPEDWELTIDTDKVIELSPSNLQSQSSRNKTDKHCVTAKVEVQDLQHDVPSLELCVSKRIHCLDSNIDTTTIKSEEYSISKNNAFKISYLNKATPKVKILEIVTINNDEKKKKRKSTDNSKAAYIFSFRAEETDYAIYYTTIEKMIRTFEIIDSHTGKEREKATQTGAAQTGAAQTGAAQTGAAQTGAAQTGAAQTGAPQQRAASESDIIMNSLADLEEGITVINSKVEDMKKRIIDSSSRQIEDLRQQISVIANEEAKKIVETAKAEAERESSLIMKEADKKVEDLQRNIDSSSDIAVDLIVRMLLDDPTHSNQNYLDDA